MLSPGSGSEEPNPFRVREPPSSTGSGGSITATGGLSIRMVPLMVFATTGPAGPSTWKFVSSLKVSRSIRSQGPSSPDQPVVSTSTCASSPFARAVPVMAPVCTIQICSRCSMKPLPQLGTLPKTVHGGVGMSGGSSGSLTRSTPVISGPSILLPGTSG